jgi:DNA-binding MarR family transcriptional regulator
MSEYSVAVQLHRLVSELDRAADSILQANVGITYKRFLFLSILLYQGTITQHELAVALGYSDPAVSTMLLALAKESQITTSPSPEHGRKRLVTITPLGIEIVTRGRQILDAHFDELLQIAGVDARLLSEMTEHLHQALGKKKKKML